MELRIIYEQPLRGSQVRQIAIGSLSVLNAAYNVYLIEVVQDYSCLKGHKTLPLLADGVANTPCGEKQ